MRLVPYADEDGQSLEIKVKTKSHGDVSITDIEFPEYESMQEFTNKAQDEEVALKFVNRAVKDKKLSEIRARLIGLPKNADLDVAREKIRERAKDGDVFTSQERISTVNAKKAAGYDSLTAKLQAAASEGRELSPDELMELLTSAGV